MKKINININYNKHNFTPSVRSPASPHSLHITPTSLKHFNESFEEQQECNDFFFRQKINHVVNAPNSQQSTNCMTNSHNSQDSAASNHNYFFNGAKKPVIKLDWKKHAEFFVPPNIDISKVQESHSFSQAVHQSPNIETAQFYCKNMNLIRQIMLKSLQGDEEYSQVWSQYQRMKCLQDISETFRQEEKKTGQFLFGKGNLLNNIRSKIKGQQTEAGEQNGKSIEDEISSDNIQTVRPRKNSNRIYQAQQNNELNIWMQKRKMQTSGKQISKFQQQQNQRQHNEEDLQGNFQSDLEKHYEWQQERLLIENRKNNNDISECKNNKIYLPLNSPIIETIKECEGLWTPTPNHHKRFPRRRKGKTEIVSSTSSQNNSNTNNNESFINDTTLNNNTVNSNSTSEKQINSCIKKNNKQNNIKNQLFIRSNSSEVHTSQSIEDQLQDNKVQTNCQFNSNNCSQQEGFSSYVRAEENFKSKFSSNYCAVSSNLGDASCKSAKTSYSSSNNLEGIQTGCSTTNNQNSLKNNNEFGSLRNLNIIIEQPKGMENACSDYEQSPIPSVEQQSASTNVSQLSKFFSKNQQQQSNQENCCVE